jgi:DNA polymerase family A
VSIAEDRWKRWADCVVRRVERDQPQRIAFDTETTGVGFYDTAFAATLTWRTPAGQLQSGYLALEDEGEAERIQALGNILRSVPEWVFWNAKFDMQKALLSGAVTWPDIDRAVIHDGQTVFTLLDENSRKALKLVAPAMLGEDRSVIGRMVPKKVKSGPRAGQIDLVPKEKYRLDKVRRKLKLKKEDGYHLLPRSVIVPYALRDTMLTLRLFELLMPRLEGVGDQRLLDIYAERMELKRALLWMEEDGFALDLPYLDETTSAYGVRVMEAWGEVVRLTGDSEFNPGSPAQILKAFDKRGIELENTQASTLTVLDDELARNLIQYREDQKVYKTYLRAIQSEHRDGIIHPNFNDDAARTGRMSSSAASNN